MEYKTTVYVRRDMILRGDNYRSMSDVICFWGGTIEVSKFIIYSPYRVLMDLLIMIKKNGI